jgi:hypothetical protein
MKQHSFPKTIFNDINRSICGLNMQTHIDCSVVYSYKPAVGLYDNVWI